MRSSRCGRAMPKAAKAASLRRPRAKPVLVWSDAMFEAGAELEDGGGWVVLVRKPGATPVFFVSFGATPVDVRRAFVEGKSTYIGQLEFLWGHSPYASIPGEFEDQLAIHFIDNTSAVAGFVKGYARPVDSAMIVHGQAATCVALGCTPFYYYVRSSWTRKQARHTIVLGERGFNGFHKCIGGIFALRL